MTEQKIKKEIRCQIEGGFQLSRRASWAYSEVLCDFWDVQVNDHVNEKEVIFKYPSQAVLTVAVHKAAWSSRWQIGKKPKNWYIIENEWAA
jgi:hypothetical protein